MSNNFEHKVQAALEGFTIEPSAETWKNIEQQLPTKKKRRFAFWWMAITVVVVAIGLTIATNKNNPWLKSTKNDKTTTPSKSTEKLVIQQSKNHELETKSYENILKKNNQQQKTTKNLSIKSSSKNFNTKSFKNSTPQKTSNELIIANNLNENVTVEDNHNLTMKMVAKPNDNLVAYLKNLDIKNPTKSFSLNQENLNTAAFFSNNKITTTSKKWTLNVNFGAGVQHIKNSSLFTSNTEKAENSTLSNTGGGGGFGAGGSILTPPTSNASNSVNLPLPNTGINLKVGFTAIKSISKTCSFSTGVLYQYTQNTSKASLDSVGRASNFYIVNNNQTFANSSHSVQIPIVLHTKLYQNKRTSFSLITGIAGNWFLNTTYLQANTNQSLFIENSNNYNRLLWNAQIGIGINFNDKFLGQIVLNQGITPIHRTGTKNYFSSVDAMLSIPLKSIIKTKK